EPLVPVALAAERGEIESVPLESRRRLRAVRRAGQSVDGRSVEMRERLQDVLDLGVGVEARDLLLQNEVRAHAVISEIPDAFFVFRAVRVAVEVTHAGPLGVLEQLHEEEGALLVFAPEAQVLIVPARLLPVEID